MVNKNVTIIGSAHYRLSRACSDVECAFAVCTTKWRVLLSCMQFDVENAIKVVLACCVLNNFLQDNEPSNQRVQFMDLWSTVKKLLEIILPNFLYHLMERCHGKMIMCTKTF